jgi:dihydrofolate reductase
LRCARFAGLSQEAIELVTGGQLDPLLAGEPGLDAVAGTRAAGLGRGGIPHYVLVITYSMSLSADGYVAGPDGSFDWAVPSEELHRFHNERVAAVDAQLLGRRLYETMLVWDTEEFSDPVMAEFAEIWRPFEKIVFSTTLGSVEGSNRLARGTLEQEIAALGERRIAVGGAGLAAECMRRGLVDEFELFVLPVVVGGGTPYFPPDVQIDLELVETRTFGATVYLRYCRRG